MCVYPHTHSNVWTCAHVPCHTRRCQKKTLDIRPLPTTFLNIRCLCCFSPMFFRLATWHHSKAFSYLSIGVLGVWIVTLHFWFYVGSKGWNSALYAYVASIFIHGAIFPDSSLPFITAYLAYFKTNISSKNKSLNCFPYSTTIIDECEKSNNKFLIACYLLVYFLFRPYVIHRS